MVAFDPEGCRAGRFQAKMLACSLLRTMFSGDIVIFRNFEVPVFPVARRGVTELHIETPVWSGPEGAEECHLEALSWRFRAREALDPAGYDKVLYLDIDCIALRNIEHLLSGDWEVCARRERGRSIREDVFNGYLTGREMGSLEKDGVNAGTVAVRADLWSEVMGEWERIFLSEPARHGRFRDQTSWNRLLLDFDLRVAEFERGGVSFPFHPGASCRDWLDSTIAHMIGGTLEEKLELAFGTYMARFFRDPGGMFLDFLEP
jgi:hypothetical protein